MLTNDRPNARIILREGLIDHQTDALRSVGVDDIVLVVGCKADQGVLTVARPCAISKMPTTSAPIASIRCI